MFMASCMCIYIFICNVLKMKSAFELRFACAFTVESELEREPNGGSIKPKGPGPTKPEGTGRPKRPNPKDQAGP